MLKRSEPSQLHREFFLAAKDFADASEVAAEAWKNSTDGHGGFKIANYTGCIK